MIRRYSIIALPIILILLTGMVTAQDDQGPNASARRSPLSVLARFLELTEDQVETTRGFLESRNGALEPLRQERAALNEEWKELISADPPDATAIGEVALELRAVREDIADVVGRTKDSFMGILDEDQQRKLRGLRRAERLQPIVKTTKTLRLF